MTGEFTRREVNRSLLAAAFALAAPGAAPPRVAVPLFDFAIAGGHHHDLYEVRDLLALGEHLTLRAEPDNPHDANAIAVDRSDGLMLGYVPRAANEPIAALLARDARIEATIVERIRMRSYDEPPADLAFTNFSNGDPRIRLTLVG